MKIFIAGKKLLLNIATAGLGHNPPKPQLIPKRTEPLINLLSMWLIIGIWKFVSYKGEDLFKEKKYPIDVVNIPPIITKANDGSQFCVTLRNS